MQSKILTVLGLVLPCLVTIVMSVPIGTGDHAIMERTGHDLQEEAMFRREIRNKPLYRRGGSFSTGGPQINYAGDPRNKSASRKRAKELWENHPAWRNCNLITLTENSFHVTGVFTNRGVFVAQISFNLPIGGRA